MSSSSSSSEINLNSQSPSSDLSKLSFEFATTEFEIDKWRKNPSNYESIKIIEIENSPTTLEASKLISNSLFRSSLKLLENFSILILKVNEKLNENHAEKPKIHEFNHFKRNILISYESNNAVNEKIIFWKNGSERNFITIYLLNEYSLELTDYVRNFLIDNVNVNLEISNYKNFELVNLNDGNNSNLLMKAVESGQNIALIDEILNLPFDINQKSCDGKTAADIAWSGRKFQILLQLLEANSTFPNNFNINDLKVDLKVSQKIEEILNVSMNLHDAIEADNSMEIYKIINDNLNLTYFYNSSNVSAATKAIKSDKIEIYRILLENECCIGPEEDFNRIINEAYEKSEINEPKIKRIKREILSTHDDNSIALPEKHLMILCANSVISHDNQFARLRLKLIKDALNFLNEIPTTKQILQLTSMHNNFKIYYDFNRSSVEFMNPYNGDQSMRGLYEYVKLKSFYVYIAAKMLLNENDRILTIATLAHELCHFAMTLTFCNDAKPYAIDDDENKMKFEGIIMTSNGLKDSEQIVSLVYSNYDENEWPSELIVRVPHMIVNYTNNSNRLDELKLIFKDLFDYYNDVIVLKVNQTLSMLEMLFNYSNEINFNHLTDAYKAKIRHSIVNFQGVDVKFEEIFGDSEIYLQLTSKQIRKILIKNESLVIGCAHEIKTKFYAERDFIDYNIASENDFFKWIWNDERNKYVWPEKVLNKLINFSQLSSLAEENKMILLSDHAGEGKTTTFKHLSMKLKEKFSNHWISYIDLKRHLRIYEKFEQNFIALNIILEILSINNEFEVKIFTQLFNNNKVILLYDGVDEIAPKFKDFFIKLIASVRNLTQNQQWIATRPQHTQELMTKFNQKSFKLLPCDQDKEIELIGNIMKNLKLENLKPTDVAKSINKTFMQSPLMFQMMIEIYATDGISSNDSNMFSLYTKMILMKKRVLSHKGAIANEDRDNHKAKLTIWQVHQIHALKLFYKNGFRDIFNTNNFHHMFDISEFQLLKRWKKEKLHWTPEAISRYGFLIVDNWNTNDEFPDFAHRTFAEFFIAQFAIQDLYELDEDDDDEMSEKEIEIRFKFLFETVKYNIGIRSFILNFCELNESKKMQKTYFKIITSSGMQKFLIDNYTNTEEYIKILSFDERFLKEFRFNEGKTIFQHYLNENTDFSDILYIVDIYAKSLGANWIHHTGYSLKENFSMPSDEEICDILKQEFTNAEIFNVFNEFKKSFLFLMLLDKLEMTQNDFIKILSRNFNQIAKNSFFSLFLMEKLLQIIQNNLCDCKSEFFNILTKSKFGFYGSAKHFHNNGMHFFEKLEEFLQSDEQIRVDDVRSFIIKLFIYCFGFKNLINSYEDGKFTKSEIQKFLTKHSVEFFDFVSDDFGLSIEELTNIFKIIFDTQSELKIFFEARYEDEEINYLKGHSVLSRLNDSIDVCRENYAEEKAENLVLLKSSMIEILKELNITDDEVEELSKFVGKITLETGQTELK